MDVLTVEEADCVAGPLNVEQPPEELSASVAEDLLTATPEEPSGNAKEPSCNAETLEESARSILTSDSTDLCIVEAATSKCDGYESLIGYNGSHAGDDVSSQESDHDSDDTVTMVDDLVTGWKRQHCSETSSVAATDHTAQGKCPRRAGLRDKSELRQPKRFDDFIAFATGIR